MNLQTHRAAASDFVVQRHEWFQGRSELGPAGQRHLSELPSRMRHEPHMVIIEPAEPDLKLHFNVRDAALAAQELNQTRRFQVVQTLHRYGVEDAEMRVQIAYPQAEGLHGAQATRIFNSLGRSGLSTRTGTGTAGGGVSGLGGGGSITGGRF